MWYSCGLSGERPTGSDLMIIHTGEAGMVVSVTLLLLIYGVGAT
jgi:hypothetical protein